VCLQDLESIVKRLVPKTPLTEITTLEDTLFDIQQEHAPEGSTFYRKSAKTVASGLISIANKEAAQSGTGIVHMDKEIAAMHKNEESFSLNVSRANDNSLVARIGTTKTYQEQLTDLQEWATQKQYTELLFIDDVLAFGSTTSRLFTDISAQLPEVTIRLLVGLASSGGIWRGIQTLQEQVGIDPEYAIRIEASPEIEDVTKGMAIPTARDFTVMGGKLMQLASGQTVTLPYFLPFCIPQYSFVKGSSVEQFSKQLLTFNTDMFAMLNDYANKNLTMQDLLNSNFGIPYTDIPEQQQKLAIPGGTVTVLDYLQEAKNA
jgi:hypothetical protein